MWSIGHWNGSCREEPGMLLSWGAHQRSMPHHSCGITRVRFRLLAIAMAVRTCHTPQLSFLPQREEEEKRKEEEKKKEEKKKKLN